MDDVTIEWSFEDIQSDRLAIWTRDEMSAFVRGNPWTGAGWHVMIGTRIVCQGQCSNANAFQTAMALAELAVKATRVRNSSEHDLAETRPSS